MNELDNDILLEEVPDESFGTTEEIIQEYGLLPYNIFLYNKRMDLCLSRKSFSKKLNINYFRYMMIEKGYFKPNKKEIEKISLAFDVDYSIYLEGLASYPEGLTYEPKRKKEKHKIFRTKPFKITLISILSIFLVIFILARIYNSNVNNFSRNRLDGNYKILVEELSKSEDYTYSISSSLTRPTFFKKTEDEYISIKGEYYLSPFKMDFQYTHFTNDYRISFFAYVSEMDMASFSIHVTYVDYKTYDEASGFITYQKNNLLSNPTLYDTETLEDITDTKILNLTKDYSLLFKEKIEGLINEKLNIDFNIDKDILGTTLSLRDEMEKLNYTSLLLYLVSLVSLVIGGLILVYSFIGGRERHSSNILSEEDFENHLIDSEALIKDVPKDIKIFPFLPETLYQVLGSFFAILGVIISIVYFVLGILGKNSIFSNVGLNSLMTLFVTGIFLLLFVDFDIYLSDRRSFRNVFIYLIIFFFVYNIQVTLIGYIEESSIGLLAIEKFGIRLPNYFGSFACYFLLMVFLFLNPKSANTKTKLIIFRLCSIIPIFLLCLSTTLSIGANGWGWKLPQALLYLIDTAKPQISILVISYLVGLYFLRHFFKKRYGVKNALRFFNGNRYLFCKNILVAFITIIISIFEMCFMHNPVAVSLGFGLYPTFFILGLLLLFHRPHLGRRMKRAERSTLVLNLVLFVLGYIFIAIILILVILFLIL